MRVEVHREHIANAVCGIPQKCMIALAIKDQDSAASYVAVRANGITVTRRFKSGRRIRLHFAVPLKAARRIIKFDQGEPVEPFSFEPKLIEQVELPETTKAEQESHRKYSRKVRAAWKAAGQPRPKYDNYARTRIAGV